MAQEAVVFYLIDSIMDQETVVFYLMYSITDNGSRNCCILSYVQYNR